LFLTVLQTRSKQIPNLISPHLGDRISINLPVPPAPTAAKPGTTVIAALPLGGRIKLNPWTNGLEMLKSKPVGQIAEREKMPFEVTPFVLYLTRYDSNTGNAAQNPSAVSADSKQGGDATDQDANRK